MFQNLTPKQARRATLASLLAVERAARLRLSASLSEVSDRASREIASGGEPHSVLVGASHLLEQYLARDLLLVRTAARREAGRTFRVESLACGLPALTVRLRDDGSLDRSRASAAAKAVAAFWLARGLVALTDGSDPIVAAPTATSASQDRSEAAARTEPASAFGDERDGLSDDYAEESRLRGLIVPLKVWDATLNRSCPVCVGLDGTIRPFGVDFPDGQVPGLVHPNCRCVEGILPLPVAWSGSPEDEEAA